LDAASVLTSSTREPPSASWMAVAVDRDVLPTPPLPVKKTYRVGDGNSFMEAPLV